jgi:hypothetical protein
MGWAITHIKDLVALATDHKSAKNRFLWHSKKKKRKKMLGGGKKKRENNGDNTKKCFQCRPSSGHRIEWFQGRGQSYIPTYIRS